MALWQFSLYLLPISAVQSPDGSLPLTLTTDVDDVQWPEPTLDVRNIAGAFDDLLPRHVGWSEHQTAWGTPDESCIDLWKEPGESPFIEVRLDLRTVQRDFVERLVHTVARFDMIFVDNQGRLIAANVPEVGRAISESDALRFLRDPRGFLSSLPPID